MMEVDTFFCLKISRNVLMMGTCDSESARVSNWAAPPECGSQRQLSAASYGILIQMFQPKQNYSHSLDLIKFLY